MSEPNDSPPSAAQPRRGPFDGVAPKRRPPPSSGEPQVETSRLGHSRTREEEQLRQERETFDQHHREAQSWSKVRVCMGWTSLVLFPIVTGAAVFVLVDHDAFTTTATTAASGAVLAQAIGLIVAVWRLILGKGPAQLTPVITGNAERQPES